MEFIGILLIVLYFVFSHLIAQYFGAKRKIGYGGSILWSILLSPVIGLAITLMSKPIAEE